LPNDLIDLILPSARVHLIAGNSNAGKTRWIIPTMLQWQAHQPIMGFASHPIPWAYVIGDRLRIEAEDTINSMGIDPSVITMIPAFGPDNKNWRTVMYAAAALKVGVLVWEGFGDFCEGEKKRDVRDFLSSISAMCHDKSYPGGCLTILGIMECPKMKPAEKYADPRQRVSGNSSWVYHTSSVFIIESDKPKDLTEPRRNLYASIKNGISFQTVGDFDNFGRLYFQPPAGTGAKL